MDGASKFVEDIQLQEFLTVVNIIGGFLLAISKRYDYYWFIRKYTILSIGDGLVSQIPALYINRSRYFSNRSSEEANLGEFVGRQLTIYPRAIAIAGGMLLLFAFFLSETFWPFFILSIICLASAYYFNKISNAEDSSIEEIGETASGTGLTPPKNVGHTAPSVLPNDGEQEPKLSPMESAIEQEVFGLEMGYGLLVLADKKKGGDLLDRITGARTNFAQMGMLLPTIGVRDNIELEPNEYRFLLRGRK